MDKVREVAEEEEDDKDEMPNEKDKNMYDQKGKKAINDVIIFIIKIIF